MRRRIGIIVGTMVLSRLTSAAQPATFSVSPLPALMDDRVAIKVTGLPSNRNVTIRARSQDQRDRWWRASAVFTARPDGSVDLSAQAPVSGSYSAADGMGLFWSMQPDASPRALPPFFSVTDPFKPLVAEFEAVSEGRVIGSARVERRFAAAGVRADLVAGNGVVGILYRPADGRAHRAVILLGGSEGGIPEPEGAMLASRGFTTLALAYFKAAGLPAAMQKIPIEYFGQAIHYMQSLPGFDSASVTVIGGSRGAEAALIVGSLYPEINGVVAVSGSHVRWEGSTARELPGGPAWTFQGRPLPYVRFHIGVGFAVRYLWNSITRGPISLNSMFADSLRMAGDDAQIEVERIRGPILFGSGADDRKWPSSLMSARAMDRLRQSHHPYPDERVSYEGAGHWIPSAYLPTAGLRGNMAAEIGGTPEATARAQAQWWPKLLRFLSPAGQAPGLPLLSQTRNSVSPANTASSPK